jgi:hypothetical protein
MRRVGEKAASPYYPGAGGVDAGQKTSWMWDQPLIVGRVAALVGKLPIVQNDPNVTQWDAEGIFDTYAVAGTKAIAHARWIYRVTGIKGVNQDKWPIFNCAGAKGDSVNYHSRQWG